MANVGLRSDSKQLKISIAGIDCYLNLSKKDMNLILDIPLYEIEYPFPYKFGIIYNYLYRNNEYSFGYGVDFSLPKLTYNSVNNTIIITNPDKTEDTYTYESTTSRYVSTNTTSTITKNGDIYIMSDIAGNTLKYDLSLNGMYNQHIFDGIPREISTYYGKTITTSVGYDSITYNLGTYGTTNISIGGGNEYLNTMSVICSSLDINVHNSITYTDDLHRRIQILRYNFMNAEGRQVGFKFEDEKVTIIDRRNNEAYEFDFTETDQALVNHYFYYNIDSSYNTPNEITTVNYLSNSKTEVIDNYNHKEYYIFKPLNNEAKFLYQIDNEKNLIDSVYNENAHLLEYEASLTCEGSGYYDSVLDFTNTGLNISAYTESNEIYSYITRIAYLVSGSGTLRYEKVIDGIKGDNFEVFFLVKINSINSFNLNIYLDDEFYTSKTIRKMVADSEYELVSVGIQLTESIKKIEYKFEINNSSLVIGSIRTIRRNTFMYYEYDNERRLVSLLDKEGYTNYTYGANSKLIRIDYPNGDYDINTYDDTHIDKIIGTRKESIYNSKIIYANYTYNTNYEKVTSEKLSNNTDTKFITTSKSYNTKLEVENETDELGNIVGYEYNDNRQVRKITYPITSNNKKFEYDDSSHKVKKISIENTSSGTSDDVTAKYTYDSNNKMISTITSNNGSNNTDGSVSSYEYNTSNELDKFKINNAILNKFGYNQKGQVTTIKHGNDDNIYYSLYYDSYGNLTNLKYIENNYIKEHFEFVYTKGKITSVFNSNGSTLLKSYYYDLNDRITMETSNYLNYTYEYYYDELDNIKIHKITTNGIKRIETFASNDVNIVSTTYTTNQNTINNFNVVPFNGTILSTKGNRPILFDTNYPDKEIYYFDEEYKRFSIKSEIVDLVYDFNINNSATIMLRMKLTALNGSQYIISNYDGLNHISIYLYNGTIKIYVNDEITPTNLSVITNTWYFIALRYSKIGTTLQLKIDLNDSSETISKTITNTFSQFKTYVGKKYNSQSKLKGYIMDMIAYNQVVSNNDLITLKEKLNETKTINYHLDNLRRIDSSYIKYNTNTILSKTYTYKNRTNNSNSTSNLVSTEVFNINGNNYYRSYTYDSMNRIIGISDSLFGSHTYTYDSRGFLASEIENNEALNYTYDNNGNIKSITRNYYPYSSDSFGYSDTNFKDKLTSYNNMNISYSSSCPGMITHFEDYSYTYEGKKMVEAYYANSGEYKQVTYEYDEEGLMVKRHIYCWNNDDDETYEEDTIYMYENRNLVTEIKGNTRIDYLYDNSGNLYGFIVNNTDTYYYVRDILGTILGIVNNSGVLIIKYKYDAYGNASRTNVVSNYIYNPFIYKGYYYDNEVEMYYLKSRYYNPRLRRFMVPDNINYLDKNNVGCINLYAYCNNNPINNRKIISNNNYLWNDSLFGISYNKRRDKSNFAFSGYNLFGYESRVSSGWESSPTFATNYFGRIGISSYTTRIKGRKGALFAYAGITSDAMNYGGIDTYYAGLGINLFGLFGAEFQFETLGIGAQISFGNVFFGANINLLGATSITLGMNTDYGDGFTRTDAFTVGINTGALVVALVWIFKFITQGDPSPIQPLIPA